MVIVEPKNNKGPPLIIKLFLSTQQTSMYGNAKLKTFY